MAVVEPARAPLPVAALVRDEGASFSAGVGAVGARTDTIGAATVRPVVAAPPRKQEPPAEVAAVPLAALSQKPQPPPLDGVLARHYPARARSLRQSGEANVRARRGKRPRAHRHRPFRVRQGFRCGVPRRAAREPLDPAARCERQAGGNVGELPVPVSDRIGAGGGSRSATPQDFRAEAPVPLELREGAGARRSRRAARGPTPCFGQGHDCLSCLGRSDGGRALAHRFNRLGPWGHSLAVRAALLHSLPSRERALGYAAVRRQTRS